MIPTACHELRQPGVIDEEMLMKAIIEQGPKGEKGRLFNEDGIKFEDINYLRLEFFDILRIDHLWFMTGLTKLQLCNNIIENIENLDVLVNLVELDLSFNNIGKIENLDSLVNIEVLTMFENKITVIENLDNLHKLKIFSIGNNRLKDRTSNVLYLRSFAQLRSLNLSGNPMADEDHFVDYVIAFLPQLVYYAYKMIQPISRLEAAKIFREQLKELERDEAEMNEKAEIERIKKKNAEFYTKAFVEELDGNQLFLSMFEEDTDGKVLLKMNEEVQETYNEFMSNFREATKELFNFGLEQYELRKVEVDQYQRDVKKSHEECHAESRNVLEEFLEEKKNFFAKLKVILSSNEEDDAKIAVLSGEMQKITDEFQEVCHTTWHTLMHKEMYLFEATEELNTQFERNLSEILNQFVEGSQVYFTMMRNFQSTWQETLSDMAAKFGTNLTVGLATGVLNEDDLNISDGLMSMVTDRDMLNNALTTSHDLHLLIIDQREDTLVSRARGWFSDLIGTINRKEIERNRSKVVEINHFLDIQHQELDDMTSTPLGLMLLPPEVQDALQI